MLRFLNHLSWKLKWTLRIIIFPATVCLSVRPPVTFFIFATSSPELPSQFQLNLTQLLKLVWNHPEVVKIQICLNHNSREYSVTSIGVQTFTYECKDKHILFENQLSRNTVIKAKTYSCCVKYLEKNLSKSNQKR